MGMGETPDEARQREAYISSAGGLGPQFRDWFARIIAEEATIAPSNTRAQVMAMVIREMRGSVMSGARPGSVWWSQLGSFLRFRSQSTGHPGLESDPYLLSEIQMLNDLSNRYPDQGQLNAEIQKLGVWDAAGRYPATPVNVTSTWGNMTPQTPGEIQASAISTAKGTGAGTGTGTGTGSGSGSGSGDVSVSIPPILSGPGPLGLSWPVLALAVGGAWLMFKER